MSAQTTLDVQVACVTSPPKKRDRPPALRIPPSTDVSDVHAHFAVVNQDVIEDLQEALTHHTIMEGPSPQRDNVISRSTSSASSLDPYYFGIQSPSDSPGPSLPPATLLSATPERNAIKDPTTPAKDAAVIDRRCLIGVGELATPRWARLAKSIVLDGRDDGDSYVMLPEELEVYGPDSPWTLEAMDSESGEEDRAAERKRASHSRNGRPSMTEESGGEEIVYPRKARHLGRSELDHINHDVPLLTNIPRMHSPVPKSPSDTPGPPSFNFKPRTSEEVDVNFASPGPLSTPFNDNEEKIVQKHHSLTSGNVPRTPPAKSQIDSSMLAVAGTMKASSRSRKLSDRHARDRSGSSSSSNPGDHPVHRKIYAPGVSPLSPSSSTPQLIRQVGSSHSSGTPSGSASADHANVSTPNVAQSLLRGTQEGWSCLDDEATAKALRKLDGLTSKTARARASVSSFGRPASLSRPATPPGKDSGQWEGMGPLENAKVVRRSSTNVRRLASHKEGASRDHAGHVKDHGLSPKDCSMDDSDVVIGSGSSDDQQAPPVLDKTHGKVPITSALSSFVPKHSSAPSTTYAGTATTSGSQDSSLSVAASSVSVSTSGRHSMSKARRNSGSSDISSIHSGDAASLKDRGGLLPLPGDALEGGTVPPVPPLPKDLSTYRSPPASSSTYSFPVLNHDEEKRGIRQYDDGQSTPAEGRRLIRRPSNSTSRSPSHNTNALAPQSNLASTNTANKTPSKKWSFSTLHIKLSSSPSSSSSKVSSFPLSPRPDSFGPQLRKSASKEQAFSHPSGKPERSWSPAQQDALSSVSSLASLDSKASQRVSNSPTVATAFNVTALEGGPRSRSRADSRVSPNQATPALVPQLVPTSPAASVGPTHSSRRLTPSSIPFFRRSSSQSVQWPQSSSLPTSSPTLSSAPPVNVSPSRDVSLSSAPGSARKKSSVLSLGLPSLLKGSTSRRSLHAEKSDPSQERRDAFLSEEHVQCEGKPERKKDDKDRSESRISVLMGRKRGKTLSSTDPRKLKPQNLPPIQISALPAATAQRLANLKAASMSTPASIPNSTRPTSSSRITSQPTSSMQKQSDASLRNRNHLPTIAGSPSVTVNNRRLSKETTKDISPNTLSSSTKETPTKIPRISSRTSAISTPPPKKSSLLLGRRTSVNAAGSVVSSTVPSPTPDGELIDEFGVIENGQGPDAKASRQIPGRSSPPTISRVPRQSTANSSTSGSFLQRRTNRDSASLAGLRKSSTGSVASIMSVPPSDPHRFSALSPSKGLKLFGSKGTMSSSLLANPPSQNIYQRVASPSSSRQSLSTPSPVPRNIDEEELLGDEEIMNYIRRQQAKKLASGASQQELDDLLKFPEPLAPGRPSSPATILRSDQARFLSAFERKEILDYPAVFYVGANSKKNPAIVDNPSNNYGYDDERGDYQVVHHDHLAYRYEIIDTLGKGSFGQVLHCRDHCTGESVAIKIIRNKKRFHHQALVEIKILDNLRKWDADEKHHVIKMTEHFYFRNHLCIAMELLSINLYELIKANGFVGFTTALIRRFTSQILLSLSLMQRHRIVHCDLKPENVLLRHPAKSALKVIDFGSSCFEHEHIYTYIQSRFYRSPEVILGMNYHMAIDMWSLGCILAELYTGFPIFPGENEQEQLACIMEVLGIPDKEFVNRSSRKRLFFDSNGAPRTVLNSKGRRRRPGTKTLAQVLRCNDEDFVDFVSRCLVWDPERRLKPQSAMRHPFITAGRRSRSSNTATGTAKLSISSSTVNGGRSKALMETPKKSQISAPTPLTARSSARVTNMAQSIPSNSSATQVITLGSSSRPNKSLQAHGLSFHSRRTMAAK